MKLTTSKFPDFPFVIDVMLDDPVLTSIVPLPFFNLLCVNLKIRKSEQICGETIIKNPHAAELVTSMIFLFLAATAIHIAHSITLGTSRIKSPLSFFNSKGILTSITLSFSPVKTMFGILIRDTRCFTL